MLARLRSFPAQLALVVGVGLVVRLWAVLGWYAKINPEGDQNFYWRQGQDLAQGFGYVYRNNFGERVATAVHPPLHSAYLTLVGLLHFPPDSHAPFRLACAFLGVAAVITVALAGREVAGNRAGIIAGLLAALYPNLWINDAMMLSESMFALTIALVLLASARLWNRPDTANAIFLGAAIALAALTRAEAQLLFLVLIVPLAFWLKGLTRRERVVRGATAILAGLVVMAPWLVRNAVTFEKHPLGVSTASGFVIEISNCDQTYGLAPPTDGKGNPTPGAADDTLLGYWAQECDRTPWPAGDETVVNAAKQKTGVDYIMSHKRQFPIVVLARIGRIWDVWRPGQSYDFNKFFERRGDATTIAGMAMYYPLLIASVAGLVVLRRRRSTLVPYLAIFGVTTLTAAISFGITRYRVGADVALTVLAAVALDALLRRWWPVPTPATGQRAPEGNGVGDDPDGAARDVPAGALA